MDIEFKARLEKSPAKGGWTYVVWLRRAIGKDAGDDVTVRIEERLTD